MTFFTGWKFSVPRKICLKVIISIVNWPLFSDGHMRGHSEFVYKKVLPDAAIPH